MGNSKQAQMKQAVAQILRISPITMDLGKLFEAAGYQLALVGGPVRDALLGRLGSDLDLTTNATPAQIL